MFFRAKEWEDAIKVLKGMFGLSGIEIPPELQIIFSHIGFHDSNYNLEWLISIGGNDYTPVWILFGFILIIFIKNSIEQMDDFRLNYKTVFHTSILFYYSFSSINGLSDFLYFNF